MSPRQKHPIVKFQNGRACARLPTNPAELQQRSRAAGFRLAGHGAPRRRARLSTPAALQRGLLTVALAGIGAAAGAGTCDALRTSIDTKIRASGVAGYTLTTVEADAKADGKVVGTCDQGARKIVYRRAETPDTAAPASAAARSSAPARGARDEPLLTECKDGTVSRGGDCKR